MRKAISKDPISLEESKTWKGRTAIEGCLGSREIQVPDEMLVDTLRGELLTVARSGSLLSTVTGPPESRSSVRGREVPPTVARPDDGDVADETKPPAAYSAYERLRSTTVTDGLPDRFDATAERRL